MLSKWVGLGFLVVMGGSHRVSLKVDLKTIPAIP